jgi:hypothetical protein
MALLTVHNDIDVRFDYNPQTHKTRFHRNWIGPQTHIDIALASTGFSDVNSIYVNTDAGSDSTSTGYYSDPYLTYTSAANGCTATRTQVVQVNSDFHSEDLSAINNVYFEGIFSSTGATCTYTLRTLGYTPSDSNTIYVAKTGSDSNAGTSASPKLTLGAADTAASGKKVIIKDSETYTIANRTMVADGWYAALGQTPTVQIDTPSYTATGTAFHSAATTLISSDVLTNGNIAIAWRDGADSHGKYKILTPAGAEVKGETQLDSESTESTIFVRALSNGGFAIGFANLWVGVAYTAVVRIYNAAGTLTATANFDGRIRYLSIAELADTNIVLAYRDVEDSNKGKFVRYKTDTSGSVVGSVTEFETGSASYVSVTALDDGGFVITYQDGSGKGQFCRYNSAGVLQGVKTEFAALGNYTAVTKLTTGDFIIVYGASAGYFRRYTAAGVAYDVATQFTAHQPFYNNILPRSDGGFVITYQDGSGKGQFCRYNSAGVLQGAIHTICNQVISDLSACIQSDNAFFIHYHDYTDNHGRYIENTSIYYDGFVASGAKTLNGITFDCEDNEYLRYLFNASAKITARWCEFKNLQDPIDFDYTPAYISTTADYDVQYCIMHDGEYGINAVANTGTFKNNIGYWNTNYVLYQKGTAASLAAIDIQQNTFFDNSYGLGLEDNGGYELVKNNIFSDNSNYDIYAENAMSTTYSILTGSSYHCTTSTGCIAANPLFIDTGVYDVDDIDLNLKLRILGDYSDSPAYQLSDATIDRDAGAWDSIVVGDATTWTTIYLTKPAATGIETNYKFVNPTYKQMKAGVNTSKESMLEEWKLKLTVENDEFEDILSMMSCSSNLIRFYPDPYTYPSTFITCKLIYNPFKGFTKNYRLMKTGRQDVEISFARVYE